MHYNQAGKMNLISIDDLSLSDVSHIFEKADYYLEVNRTSLKKNDILKGATIINCFVEDSTRTRTSFEIAGKRLGADVVNFSPSQSALNKGESFADTIETLSAMRSDCIIVRHPQSMIFDVIGKNLNSVLINAGDGSHEHPTQALIDAFTIQNNINSLSGKQITICGDIKHSRVARSQIKLFSKLGAKISIVGPSTLMPQNIDHWPVKVYYDMDQAIKNADIIVVLRVQLERMQGSFFPSLDEYFNLYSLTRERLRNANSNALVLHPGPVNRGVEIESDLVDDKKYSVILQQVEAGVAIRQAILELFIAHDSNSQTIDNQYNKNK